MMLILYYQMWLHMKRFPFVPAQLAGVIASGIGMMIGSLMPTFIKDELPERPMGYLHEHASQKH
jgi:hypothetical protein